MLNAPVPASDIALPKFTRRHLLAASAQGAAVAAGATAFAVIPAGAAVEAEPLPTHLPQSARDAFIRQHEAFGADEALTSLGLRFQLARARYEALKPAAEAAYSDFETRAAALGVERSNPAWRKLYRETTGGRVEDFEAAQQEADDLAIAIEKTPAATLEGLIWKARAMAWNCRIHGADALGSMTDWEVSRFDDFLSEFNRFVRGRM